MDIVDGFRVLVAAAETGSLSGAARRLVMSPKLASKYIAALEARLGARLLSRTTRRLGLTAAGERLMARAPDWLDQLDEMTADLDETGSALTGTLRISAPATYGEMHLQPALCRFQARHPGLTIDLRLSDRFVDLAAEGVDLAIRIGELADSALIARRIGPSGLSLVASPAYLEVHGTPQTPEDLSAHDCIRDTNLRGDGWPLRDNGVARRIRISGTFLVNSARAVRDLALAGRGIACCPHYVVGDDLAGGRLIALLPQYMAPGPSIHAVHLAGRKPARRVRALIDFLLEDRIREA